MPIIVTLIYMTAGIALLATIQGSIHTLSQSRKTMLAQFSLLALLICLYQLATALYYQADSVAAASLYLKWQFTFICLVVPTLILFLGNMTDDRHFLPGLVITLLVSGILLYINWVSPHSIRFVTLQPDTPLLLPWGERLAQFNGVTNNWRHLFSLTNLAVIIWFAFRVRTLFRLERNPDHYILLVLLILLAIAALWGALIDYGVIRSIYLPGFVFTLFALAMSIRYSLFFHQQTRKLQEANLEIQTFSLAAEQNPDSLVITDLTGTIQYVNQSYCTTSGYRPDEVIGQHSSHLKSEQQSPEQFKEMWETVSNGKIWSGELINKKKDGTLFLESATIFPIFDDTGTIIRYMGIKKDITEQRRTEHQQQQTRRLELIGQLAGGVAHEVRNPLNAILSNTEALFREKAFAGNHELAPYQFHIRTQVTRLSRLMNDLLDLGRTIPATSIVPLDPLAVCQEVLVLFRSSFSGSSCTITLDSKALAAGTMVSADSIRLQQVLLNLLENACQHTPENGSVMLQLFLAENKTVCFRIQDGGPGIPAEGLEHIFEPFYTSRRGGTGLGLPLAKHFSEAMGGTLTISNNDPPPGCTAELHLPIC